MKISISTKLIVMTVGFLAATTVTIAISNSQEIGRRISAREKDFNQETVHSKTIEVRAIFNSAVERTQALGLLALQNSTDNQELEFSLNKDRYLVALTIYQLKEGRLSPVFFKAKKSFFENAKVDPQFFTRLRQQLPFPLQLITAKQVAVRNSSLPRSPPLLTVGLPLTRDENNQVTHVALADFHFGLLQSSFLEKGTRTLFVTDEQGTLLAHHNEAKALARLPMARHPLVENAISAEIHNLQKEYKDPETDHAVIGAFEKAKEFNLLVVSEVDRSIIQEAVDTLISSVIEKAGMAVSIAIFLIFLFSMTLTKPIEKLADLIQLVSKGNFEVKARDKIKSRDEVGDLAHAFDRMTQGLKERDKVKNLFAKFHGSKVADDLLENDIEVGGQNRQVTVFFSDIRDFTKFSEAHTPEEVVEMLNEYLEVMVTIINSHHGVVDKFIGDAIMAVWGAPKGTDKDTVHAVKACLEMRKALNQLNEKRLARGQEALVIGMGLHCGPVISGPIGSNERMEYTVIGDTVNRTSRIEAATKAFGVDLLVSEDVCHAVGNDFQMEMGGTVNVKGKSEPLTLFKIRGFKNESGELVEVKTPYSDFAPADADKVKLVS